MADQGSIANLKQNINENIYDNTDYDISGGRMNTVLQNIVDTIGLGAKDFFNVNDYNARSTAYSNATNARQDVPEDVKKIGLVIAYILSDGWYIEQFVGSDITNWTTATNWVSYKIDAEPIENSKNIVNSGGVYKTGWGRNKRIFPFVYDDSTKLNNKERIDFIDGNNKILATIDKDGLRTKNFRSANLLESTKLGSDNPDSLIFQDMDNNILAIIDENGLRTKYFDSKERTFDIEVNLSNSEIITILGSSFGETDSFPTNKHWSGIMSMFSDYRIQNLSLGGSNIVTNLYFIRSGQWVIQGKYVLITNNENISTLNLTEFMKGIDNICATLIGMGKIPILCTNYHKSQYFSMALKNYAIAHNLMFWDCSNYCNTLVQAIYAPFDDGAHLRKRNAPMVAYAYMEHLLRMKEPMQSVKVFRLRDDSFSGNIDELVYFDNTTRAKKYKEIKISSTQSQDEYNKLINKTVVSFGKYGLVECILPANGKDINKLTLNLNTNGTNVKVYVKNTNAVPYPNPGQTSAVRFSVPNTISVPMEGDIYSIDGVNYTVLDVIMGENNYYCTIYCSPATIPSSAQGTLQLVSQMEGSTGSATISYTLVENATLNLSSFIYADNQGHWVELTNNNNEFEIPTNLFVGTIQIDKVAFLIESLELDETFDLKDIKITCKAKETKQAGTTIPFEWMENNYIQTQELISEPNFGVAGTVLTDWKDDNGNNITSVQNYEQSVGGVTKYPKGLQSEIKVSDILSMNTVIPKETLNKFGNMYLEIYCRYFPQAPTPYSQANDTAVNDDSFDFNTLSIQFSPNQDGSGANTVVMTEEIGLFWKIVRIPLCWFWQYYLGNDIIKDMYLKLYSNNKGIEICNVSLKYNN